MIRNVVSNWELNGTSTCDCYLASATVNNVDRNSINLQLPQEVCLLKQNEKWREEGKEGRKEKCVGVRG